MFVKLNQFFANILIFDKITNEATINAYRKSLYILVAGRVPSFANNIPNYNRFINNRRQTKEKRKI